MTWHRKPNAGGGPCDVCGCPGLRLGVRHRALEAGYGIPGAVYAKTRNDASGGGAVETYLDADGNPPRTRHVGPGEPPSPGATLRHVGPREELSYGPREHGMLQALGHIVETVRKDEGDPDPHDAMEAIVEILDNHGATTHDVKRVLAGRTEYRPRVRIMLEALLHITRMVGSYRNGNRDPYDALTYVIATLSNHGIGAGDVDRVLR